MAAGIGATRQATMLLTTIGAVLLTVAVDAFVLELNLGEVIAGTRSAVSLGPTACGGQSRVGPGAAQDMAR